MRVNFKTIFWGALILRLLLAIPFHSGDLNTTAIWGIYARDFGFSGFYDFLNFGNYSRPDYPPLSIIMFWLIRLLWEGIFAIFWKINILIPPFPSNFITWLDSEGYIFLLKLPGLFADFAIGGVLFWYIGKKLNRKLGIFAASLYWFNPAAIYVNSMWGQVDGIVVLLGLLSIILLEKKKLVPGLLALTASILIKATMLMLVPIVLYMLYKSKMKGLAILKAFGVSGIFAVLVAVPFAVGNPVIWLVQNYIDKFSKAAVNLPFIQLRTFNFWTLTTGFGFVSDTVQFLNIPLFEWARILSIAIFVFIAFLLIKKNEWWGATSLFIFASFLFLPRMHERYLLPILPFLLIFAIKNKRAMPVFIAVSALQMINLYAAWQVPESPILGFLTADLFARSMALSFILLFFWLLHLYRSFPKIEKT